MFGIWFPGEPRERNPKARYLRLSCRVFSGGRGSHERGQADLQLGRQPLGSEEIASLDQIIAALPFARAVFSARYYSGTGEACSGLSRGNWPDAWGRADIDRWRTPEARAGGTSVQSHPRQIDEDSDIRLGLWQISTSQSVVGSHAGMAKHAVIEQGSTRLCCAYERKRSTSFFHL